MSPSVAASGAVVVQGCDMLEVTSSGECVVVDGRDLLVRDGTIESIYPSGGPVPAECTVIDGAGLLATPGLVNAHTHSPMVLFRGAAEDVPVESWFNDRVWPMESNLTERDVLLGAHLACAEMISSGVTAFADHYFFADQIAEAVTLSGIRANIAPTYFSSQGRSALEATVDFAERWHGAAGGRLSVSMGPHAPYTVNDDDLTVIADHARRLGIGVHIHAAEHLEQTVSSLARRGITPIEVLRRTGILDAGALIAHGCGIVTADYDTLGEYADQTAVASCPKVYLKHALFPLTPVKALLELGVTVAAGTDGAAGHNTLDVWEAMRLIALTQKQATRDAMFLTLSDTLRLAMTGGAKAARLSPGGLEVGARADIVLLDLSGAHHQPLHDPRAALVYGVRASDVQTVLVAGKVLMHDRKLLTVDLPAVIDEITDRMKDLTVTTGAAVQFYDP